MAQSTSRVSPPSTTSTETSPGTGRSAATHCSSWTDRVPNYVLDEKGQIIVEVARGWLDAVYGYEGYTTDLEPLLRKELVYDRDITRRARFVAKGRGHIENWVFMPMAIDALARGNRRRVLDLGCGDAAFLRNLCVANPSIRGVGIDMSATAIEDATNFVRDAGLAERIALAVVDIADLDGTTADVSEIDAATAFFVLHEVLYRGRDVLVNALRGFRSRFPGVPLIAFEIDRATPELMRRRQGMSIQYNLQHTLSHQTLVDSEPPGARCSKRLDSAPSKSVTSASPGPSSSPCNRACPPHRPRHLRRHGPCS